MLLTDEQISQRIESPINLINRLRRTSASTAQNISNVYMIDRIVKDIDEKLTLPPPASADTRSAREIVADKSLDLINQAMDELAIRLPEVEKPERLAGVIRDLSQVVRNTDTEAIQNSNVQFVFYAPKTKTEDEFEVLDVT